MPSTRWSSVPTPPEAITGTPTASDTARVSAMSKPDLVPSRSIEVSRISPAPSSAIRRAQPIASILVGAGEQQAADVLDPAHATADGQRHEALIGGAADDVIERRALLVARRDVE